MAEEAFALSPISARPNVPGEADYDAIREAFMETTRGRWFLAEYAKRNRTADTALVLDAVTRLEANLAAQKLTPALSLAAALGTIRSAVRQAKASAIEAMPRVDSDDTLTGARNGARIIREIAWTLRECGADTRICDLLDTQVKAIEAGQQAWTGDGREDVLASYDLLMQRVEQLVDGGAPQAAAAPVAEATPSTAEAREASVTPLFRTPAGETVTEPSADIATTDMPPADAVTAGTAAADIATGSMTPAAEPPTTMQAVEPVVVIDAVPEAIAPIAEASAELAGTMAETSAAALDESTSPPEAELDAETQHDLALLDMVAAEMGALDESEAEFGQPDKTGPEHSRVESSAIPDMAPAAFEAASADTDLMTLAEIAEVALAPEPVPQPEPEPQPVAETASSLGAALIASGVIANPNAPSSDALAPIRRMTQAEKIAFFS